ncbi:polyketide biosynthesis 3-hydroxy-3-methylglutaryl-ACP synthase PksG [Nocardiopsis terrae]|uniref:Polyketide biosynthesis 3-hydroxy-3-methylglutaryl-CoA synthase-like enzyme PksG n=1 Tax=Nocardiopsis terrae TaxID=372655 RepID=A0ABR9HD28_9ACTN|nr:hydroxymethylglutaryl-CoA synthase family protein [Nocardiopsis terrae]MBE1456914.1 polyketide biosynthesis 3-hydroxy-3-methylglutaryl-CoA synthase-like enzyme PksG [Nocardiopsis terrae]GHC74421.1 polyketide biosynthesis 3-hydroxy-3-methylglutaryl-ACP synthase PksG [Nocardiopsis terrae]
MKPVGIEAVNAYCGETCIDVPALFAARDLDDARMDNLMMARKSVALHCEDAVSFAVNAAQPIVDSLTEDQLAGVELLIVGTESGIDFGKSLATYVHHHLGLPRSCRLFEIKQACYSGTAAMQMAAAVVAASPREGTRALVISSDVARPVPHTYVEPSQGAGAVAVLIGDAPVVAEFDHGANGFHSYEVMDTCRPTPEAEAGDVDLSLLTYIDCLQGAFGDYADKVDGADLLDTFDLLAMHTPFPGMVKGAHRTVLRRTKRLDPASIDADFDRRLAPSVRYPGQVGNIYAGTVFLALASALDNAPIDRETRVGIFSYGSGCSSEFYSAVVSPASQRAVRAMGIQEALDARYRLPVEEYDELLSATAELAFGTRDHTMDLDRFPHILRERFASARPRLVLEAVRDYHREYTWLEAGR